ncbi:hypothetical protein ORG27_07480 [Stenotrophomonas lactitubi]|uniref:hypothetical protein n=1 Tax=Stenotrophomonas lactitubi TaxID=2045214 RepID=UPI002248B2B3|nr:hypothetical protein [Stenotrophomonas lactitubi]MCX2893419.1 hypothetical protein [Stenotrophomonas lactitubi]
MNLEQRIRLERGYLQYLAEHEPEYFVTLTYRYPYGDRIAEMAMNGFVLKLLNRLPKRTRPHFAGLVCSERHLDVKFEGCYHFHFLFWGLDESMQDAYAWLQTNVIRAASDLYPRLAGPRCDCAEAKWQKRPKTCKGGLSCRGPQMSGPECVAVKRIDYTPEVVYEYTVGDILRLDMPAGGQLLDISPSGVKGNLLGIGLL